MSHSYNKEAMTKQEFYKELQNIGVDTTNKDQMKVWSVALLNMGRDYIAHKTDRCEDCYYERKAMKSGKLNMDDCPNEYCPMKALPSDPAQVVDYLFEQSIPLDMQAFFNKYVSPILTELAKRERENNNAG